jgi:hypothetical protein
MAAWIVSNRMLGHQTPGNQLLVSGNIEARSLSRLRVGQTGPPSRRERLATDYPHVDAHPDPVVTLKEHIKMLPSDQREWILGKGAAELYRL